MDRHRDVSSRRQAAVGAGRLSGAQRRRADPPRVSRQCSVESPHALVAVEACAGLDTAMNAPSSPSHSRIGARDLVSIIMPVRNEAASIVACLQAVLAQDYPADAFEVIIADGMSDDGTRAKIRELAERDARVRLIDN